MVALPGYTPVLDRFEATLAARDSATAALRDWCAARAIATPAAIRARVQHEQVDPATPDIRAALGVSDREPVAFRHVQLACGGAVLSDAKNWYVPARLTPEMNSALATSDTPFGSVVAPLGFQRERIASRRGRMRACPAHTVLSQKAMLRRADGMPFSLVIECYTATVTALSHR